MNHSEKTRMIVLTFAVMLAFVAGAGHALAVDKLGLFELDGNAIKDQATSADDWDTLNNGGGSALVFTGILKDPGQQTVFTGGQKDIQDISAWGWKNNGGFPDKDDITNAYATAYKNNGDLIVYFGCDRFANTGDAYLAFWFFKDKVSLNSNGKFNGKHTVGDILVLVNFPQATNAKPTVSVAKWNPAKSTAATNLELLDIGTQSSGSASVCSADDLACAMTNIGLTPITSPWPYLSKTGTSGFPYESFFEGGINLTQLLHTTTACFASFMAESRSSEQFSSTLKDFVIGEFPVCDMAVEKKCKDSSFADPALTNESYVVDFNGLVTNNGAVPWPTGSTITIVDDAGTPGVSNDDVKIVLPPLTNPVNPDQSVPFSGEFFSNSNPPYNTITASIMFPGSTVADIIAKPFSIECDPIAIPTSLSVTKRCWTQLVTVNSLLAIKVFFTGQVCNTGKAPLNVTVTDDKAGVVLQTVMNPGDCNTINGSYMPTQTNGNVTAPCSGMFSDTLTATGKSTISGVNDANTVTATANCPLCGCN